MANGQARCWGINFNGQLGDGTQDDADHAVVVRNGAGTGPLTGVVQIVAGNNGTCAVLRSGQARCWGSSTFGQLGVGDDGQHPLPTPVLALTGSGPLTGVATLTLAESNGCAVLRNHEARCWGQNTDHELGSATDAPFSYRPRRVLNRTGTGPLRNVRNISAAAGRTCATLVDGQVRCWGADTLGGLGNGPGGNRRWPSMVLDVDGVGPLTGASRIASGRYHSCVVVTGREVRCWGDGTAGAVGDDSTGVAQLPVVVHNTLGQPRLVTVTQIGLSEHHSCARLVSGRARCWGANGSKELGNRGTLLEETHPVPVLAPL
jgi:alpha-tubulin suppressor-like RCC1 family protein